MLRNRAQRDQDFRELRKSFDGSDTFMGGQGRRGHRVIKPRRPKRKLPTPDWAVNDTLTRELMEKMFPACNLPDDPRYIKHRYRAGLYSHIFYRFFREGEKARYIWLGLRDQEAVIRAGIYDNADCWMGPDSRRRLTPIERYRRKVRNARPLTERRIERIIQEMLCHRGDGCGSRPRRRGAARKPIVVAVLQSS